MVSWPFDKGLPLLTREEEIELGRRQARTWGNPSFNAETNTFAYTLYGSLRPRTKYIAELGGLRVQKTKEVFDPLTWSFTTSKNGDGIEPEFKRGDGLNVYVRPYNETEVGTKPIIEVKLGMGLGLSKVNEEKSYLKGYHFMLWDSEAVNTIAEHNIGLVKTRALLYRESWDLKVFEFEDLVGVGFVGLIKAGQRFDYRKGIKFSTHGVYWIDQAIEKYVNYYGFRFAQPVASIAS